MSMMDTKCLEICSTLAPSHGLEAASASPFLDFIKQLMSQLLPLLVNCLPKASRAVPADVTKAINNPNLRQRAGLRWAVRSNIDDPRTGNMTVPEICEAFLTMGKGCTEEHTAALMSEVA